VVTVVGATLNQALADQHGPQQLRRPLVCALLVTTYKDVDLRQVSHCLVALQTTEIPPLLYCLLVNSSLYPPCIFLLLYLQLFHAMLLRCWPERNHLLLQFRYCFIPISFRGNLITEPLYSSGCFLDCDWRLACQRSASLYIVTNGAWTNGHLSCHGLRWLASAWFNVGGAHTVLTLKNPPLSTECIYVIKKVKGEFPMHN
jgi:hypothetical protein